MKKLILNTNVFPLILTLVISMGCQQEVEDIIKPSDDIAIDSNSVVADLVKRTSLRDGSVDNILDHSSCISLELPVTVIVNETELTVASEDDFKKVERLLDEFEDDEDIVQLIFPVTVITQDHTEIIINNEEELEELTEDCPEEELDDDIECIDFQYPLTLSIYDTDNQISDIITINNDRELYESFENLDDDELVSFDFPITVIFPDLTEMSVKNNDELEDLLEDAIDSCDEDDDNDYNDDDIDDFSLKNILIDGNWKITYFFDDEDETSLFEGFIFSFKEDGGLLVTDAINQYKGFWKTYGDDGTLELEISFGEISPFEEIDDDWTVLEFGETIIRLTDESDEGSDEFLTFEITNEDPGNTGQEDSLAKILVAGPWIVALYSESGEEKTTDYNGFQLTFDDSGNVVANNGEETYDGSWDIGKDDGIDKLILEFAENTIFDEFNEDWEIVDYTESRIELLDSDEELNTEDKLVFEIK